MKLLFFICLTGILPFTALFAQEVPDPCLDEVPSNHLGIDVSLNSDDVFVGGTFHFADIFGEGFSIIGTVVVRPYGKRLLVEESPGVYLYLREERFSVLMGLERQLFLSPQFSGYAHLLGGLSVPRYRGTKRETAEFMFPVVGIGVQWALPCARYFAGDDVVFRLGAQYVDIPDNQFRGYCSVLFAL